MEEDQPGDWAPLLGSAFLIAGVLIFLCWPLGRRFLPRFFRPGRTAGLAQHATIVGRDGPYTHRVVSFQRVPGQRFIRRVRPPSEHLHGIQQAAAYS